MFKSKSEKVPGPKPDQVLQIGDVKVKRFVLKKKKPVIEEEKVVEEIKKEEIPV